MKIRNIALDDEGLPTTVTAELTLAEVCLLAKYTGGTSSDELDKVISHGASVAHGIYDATTSEVLHRFYDDGVDDAVRTL